MDWYPTLASFAGIKIPEEIVIDGRDLTSLLKGETDEISFVPNNNAINAAVPYRRYWNPPFEWDETIKITRDEYLNAFFYHGSQGDLSAVRSGKWKLFINPSYTLYDLEKDPGERIPIINHAIVAKLRGMTVLFQEEMRLTSRPAGLIRN